MSTPRMELPLTNHYGLPYTDEERVLHRSMMPAEPQRHQHQPVASPIASYALQHGIDALFRP